MLELLKELCSVAAPSGSEGLLHHVIKREISPYADDIKTDVLGNLIVHIEGKGPKVMFAAHTDSIGVVVTHIKENGMANFARLGDFDTYTALHQRVRFTNGTTGIVSCEAGTLKDLKTSDLFIDFGTDSREKTEKLIKIGQTACFIGEFSHYEGRVCSAALDDRAGCCVLIETIKKITNPKNDLYFVFTAEQELNSRGAKTAAGSINPDYAVVVDTTCGKASLGSGAIIKVMDESFIVHPYINELISSVCDENDILHRYEASMGGYNDAGCIHQNKDGVPSGCIAIPIRYRHTPCEMIDMSDVGNCSRIIEGLIEKGF